MNTFEFVRYSKNDVRVRSMFDDMVFDPSLIFNKPLLVEDNALILLLSVVFETTI